MNCVVSILSLATADIGWFLTIVAAFCVTILVYFRPSRKKSMATLAAQLGLQFFPKLSADQMGTRGASFVYGEFAIARNCMRGIINGRETVIFDQYMEVDPVSGRSEGPIEGTVVGFRVAPDSFCRDRGVIQRTFWHVEKMGEWVFVYHEQPLVKPAEISCYVEEARARFKTATNPRGALDQTTS